jgi:small subunit ribosomal protein S14
MVKQQKPPKFKARRYNRCKVCGRRRGYIGRFAMCRLCFREMASKGEMPGVVKASW